jgi:signal transduction histidine kinase
MLRSILQNLVTNAIKFTPDGGHVRLGAEQEEGMIGIYIQDTGIGMNPEIKDHLFSRTYTTATVSGTNNEIGSGLGLLLVQDFVAQHGGTISVESEHGKGTTFRFTVPNFDDAIEFEDTDLDEPIRLMTE